MHTQCQDIPCILPQGFVFNTPLVSVSALYEALQKGTTLQLWDVRYALPNAPCRAEESFQQKHLPESRFVCLDTDLSVPDPQGRPHMMPAADVFATLLGRLDYHPQVPLVLVDTGEGLRSAARVWWMFQSVGLENVWLLDGGLKAWEREGLPVTHTHSATPSLKEVLPATVQRIHGCMKPDRLHLYWCDKQAIDNRDVARTPVLDARMPERFLGTVPEPRAGLRSGHIEGSCNMPFHQVYDTATGKFLAPEKLHVLLSPYMKDATSLFTTCGSGVTACSLAVALRLLDTDVNAKIPPVMVYDGSWAEYGMQF